jgi:hypothetical protein
MDTAKFKGGKNMFSLKEDFRHYAKHAGNDRIKKEILEIDGNEEAVICLVYDDDRKIVKVLKGFEAAKDLSRVLANKYINKCKYIKSIRRAPLYSCMGDVITVYHDNGYKQVFFTT